jgi:hypothetical protein
MATKDKRTYWRYVAKYGYIDAVYYRGVDDGYQGKSRRNHYKGKCRDAYNAGYDTGGNDRYMYNLQGL